MCVGGPRADAAFEELEASIKRNNVAVGSRAQGSMGDVLTVLLLVWLPHNTSVLQRALASPAVYPLLATLVVRGGRSRVLVTGAGVTTNTLHGLLSELFSPNQNPTNNVGSLSLSSSSSESLLRLPECLSAEYLAAQLVGCGRVAAAAELTWRAAARPLTLLSARNGLVHLRNVLEGKQAENTNNGRSCACLDIYRTAFEIVESAMR